MRCSFINDRKKVSKRPQAGSKSTGAARAAAHPRTIRVQARTIVRKIVSSVEIRD